MKIETNMNKKNDYKLSDWDLQILFHFIRRPEMYTGATSTDDYKRVDQFLMAYELGTKGECRFRETLIEQVENKYNIPFPAEGLNKQLSEAAKKSKQKIQELFVNESLSILIEASDANNGNRFVNIMRKKLIDRLRNLPEEINISWGLNFSRILKELKDWKGVNLQTNEISLATSVLEEANSIIKEDVMKNKKVTGKLRSMSKELIQLLIKKC